MCMENAFYELVRSQTYLELKMTNQGQHQHRFGQRTFRDECTRAKYTRIFSMCHVSCLSSAAV